MLSLRDIWLLDLLAEVLDRGSMSAAAQSRNVSTSTVSEGVGRLETLLGEKLVVRTTRGCRPTRRGAEIQAQLQPAVHRLQTLLDELNGLPAAPLRIGSMFGSHNNLLADVARSHEWLTIRGVSMPIDDPAQSLLDGSVDMALLMGPTRADHQLQRHYVFSETRLAVLPKSRVPADVQGLSLAQLDHLKWPDFPPGSDELYLKPWICCDVRPGWPPGRGQEVAEPFAVRDWMQAEPDEAVVATTPSLLAIFDPGPTMAAIPILDVPGWPVHLCALADSSLPTAEVARCVRATSSSLVYRDPDQVESGT